MDFKDINLIDLLDCIDQIHELPPYEHLGTTLVMAKYIGPLKPEIISEDDWY